ncbi:MAG: hypothetical protein WDM90_21975 [Ferruginibacter sp.]
MHVVLDFGTYTAPPTDSDVLKKFYSTVKPWGFWQTHSRIGGCR